MRKILLGIILLLLTTSVVYSQQSVQPLQLTIKSDKQVYEVGESININVIMKNTSDKEVIVWHAGFWANHRIILVDSNNQRVKLTEFGETCEKIFNQPVRTKNVRWPLKPNQEDIYEFELNKIYLIQSPDTYYLTVIYEENWEDGWQGSLTSNTITIKVTEKKGISKEEALNIAEKICKESGWEWKDVSIRENGDKWSIITNAGARGMNAFIDINKKTGKVLRKDYSPY